MEKSERLGAAAARHQERLYHIHILIIISSVRAGDLIKRLFLNLGFTHLHIAYDAVEAVHFLRDTRVHLIISDADLKVSANPQEAVQENHLQLNGIHFVHRLRTSPASPAPFIPVLMLMDRAREADVSRARDAGVNEIVLKPMEARDFCERIIQMIDNPRHFITAETYRGPCRRQNSGPPPGTEERRVREIRLVRCNEMKGSGT